MRILVAAALFCSLPAVSIRAEVAGWWRFEASDGDPSGVIRGNSRYVPGVVGTGLKLDGFTGFVSVGGAAAPGLGGGFSIEAWVALGAYPWSFCPIVDQEDGSKAGYVFGIDADGGVGLFLFAGGEWQGVVSAERVGLRQWAHVAGVYDPKGGVTVYVDGQAAGSAGVEGEFVPAGEPGLLIGRSRHKQIPARAVRPAATFPSHTYFDGIIDELKIHDRCLGSEEVAEACRTLHPEARPALSPRVLPAGPPGPGRFGAYYTRLTYYEEWDALWRVGHQADVIVRFDEADYRFVFWRGTSYVPCWVTKEGMWYTNEFNETWGHGAVGCAEPMSDKQCRHSHVRIIESHDARAVIHWRYGLTDVRYVFARVDEETGWGDWSDEVYTIYPDGVGVRKVTLWSSQPGEPHEFQDSITIHSPGRRPEDDIETEAVILANMAGQTHTYSWANGCPAKMDKPERANIEVINLKSATDPFLIVSDAPCIQSSQGPRFRAYCGELRPEVSMFPWWNHWPVAQIACDGRNAVSADRASHSCLTNQLEWADDEMTDKLRRRIMLHGMTDGPAGQLAVLARSWLRAPQLRLTGGSFVSEGYDQSERAYVLRRREAGSLAGLECELAASEDSPVVNLALIIEQWGDSGVALMIDGKPIARGKDFRFGYRNQLTGTDLIVWIKVRASAPLRLTLTGSGGG